MRLIIRDARIPDGKAAGRDRRQRRGDRIEQREARNAQQQRLRHGERDVDAVQDARRLTRAGAELCADGAGGFRFHQVHAALAELGQQRQHQNEDTHAAHPLRERAPELDALRQRRRRREDGRAGRRQAGDGLENGVDKAAAAAEKIRQRAEHAQRDPAQCHADKAVARLEPRVVRADEREQHSHAAADKQRVQKGPLVNTTVEHAQQQRRDHTKRLDTENDAHDSENKILVHNETSLPQAAGTSAENIVEVLQKELFRHHDHAVARMDLGMTVWDLHPAVVHDGRNEQAVSKMQVAERPVEKVRGTRRGEFDRLDRATEDIVQALHRAALRVGKAADVT